MLHMRQVVQFGSLVASIAACLVVPSLARAQGCDLKELAACCDYGGGAPCLAKTACPESALEDIERTLEQCTVSDAPQPKAGVIPAGAKIHKSKATGYFPQNSRLQGGYRDRRGAPLQMLQQFLAGKASFVSVAMDDRNGVPYGTRLRILELERKYGRVIEFRVVDTGGAFYGMGMSRIDICTSSDDHAWSKDVNRTVTLVFPRAAR